MSYNILKDFEKLPQSVIKFRNKVLFLIYFKTTTLSHTIAPVLTVGSEFTAKPT